MTNFLAMMSLPRYNFFLIALLVTVAAASSYGAAPSVTTQPVSSQFLSANAAVFTGLATANGQSTTVWFEYGTTISYGQFSSTNTIPFNAMNTPVVIGVSNLVPNTLYHVRAAAKNSAGTAFGQDQTFTTPPPAASVTTLAATLVTSNSATLNASLNPHGYSAMGWFEWGTSAAYGNFSPQTNLGAGSVAVTNSFPLSGLSPGVTWHFRAAASNGWTTTYGNDRTFRPIPFYFQVSTLADGGSDSLRQALASSVSGDFIVLVTNGTIVLTNGPLAITKNLTIIGPGPASLAISANNQNRVFEINTNTSVSISGLTIRDGRTPDGSNGTPANPHGEDAPGGGGILNLGALTLSNCVVTANHTGSGGDSYAASGADGGTGGAGGGLVSSNSALTLLRCALFGNSTGSGGHGATTNTAPVGGYGGWGGEGGAVFSFVTSAQIIECSISNNITGPGGDGGAGTGGVQVGGPGGPGGGIFFIGGSNAVLRSTINSNRCGTAGYSSTGGGGGGVGLIGSCLFQSSTFVGNAAGDGGMSLIGHPGGEGGAIAGRNLTITACTIYGNFAGSQGPPEDPQYGFRSWRGTVGGVYSSYPFPSFPDTNGSVLVVDNTIIASNSFGSGEVNTNFPIAATNFFGPLTPAGPNLIAIDPQLLPLSDNGGATLTMLFQPSSPAFDAGDDAVVGPTNNLTTDQRGYPREVLGHVDVGACELQISELAPKAVVTLGATVSGADPANGTRSVTFIGAANPQGLPTTAWFEFGLTTNYGAQVVPYSIGSGASTVTSSGIGQGLSSAATCHYRFAVTNRAGAAYGADQTIYIAANQIAGDLNGDGIVDQSELNTVLSNYFPNSPWMYMTNVIGLGQTNVQFALTNFSAWNFSVLVSTNLTDWDFLGTANPLYQFSDPVATNGPQRYYRLRWP